MQLGPDMVSAWKIIAFVGPNAKVVKDPLGGHSIIISLGKGDAQLRIDISDYVVRSDRSLFHRYSEKEFNTTHEIVTMDYIKNCQYHQVCRARWKDDDQGILMRGKGQ